MNVVDSSAWLEYFAAGPNSAFFSDAIENTGELFIPSICLYEVFKKIISQRSENDALQAVALTLTLHKKIAMQRHPGLPDMFETLYV